MNSKEEQTNSEDTDLEIEESKEKLISPKNINQQPSEIRLDEKLIDNEDEYKFGWSRYSEITNGRFAMIGFLSIILIELFSQESFLKWAGIL